MNLDRYFLQEFPVFCFLIFCFAFCFHDCLLRQVISSWLGQAIFSECFVMTSVASVSAFWSPFPWSLFPIICHPMSQFHPPAPERQNAHQGANPSPALQVS